MVQSRKWYEAHAEYLRHVQANVVASDAAALGDGHDLQRIVTAEIHIVLHVRCQIRINIIC